MADVAGYRQQPPQQRPRTSSMLSWGSHKSKDSAGKIDLTESEKDKAQRRIKGKADPSVAINELQPSAQALEKSTMAPLRSMQFRDRKGDLITDPDRSNPTRYRFERPLDTIRSFEAAIENGYRRRYSVHPDMQSRRSSVYQTFNRPRTPGQNQASYFDQVPASRPESVYDPQSQANGYAYGQTTPGWQGSSQPRRQPHGRMMSEPALSTHPHANGAPSYQQGYEAGTASSSGTYQTEHSGGSTNPSSFNDSNGEISHVNPASKPQPPAHQESYGVDFQAVQQQGYYQQADNNGHGQSNNYGQDAENSPAYANQYNESYNASYGHNEEAAAAPPPPPPHANGNGRLRKAVGGGANAYPRPMNTAYNQPPSPESERPKAEKRKSWLARRFSKQS